MAEVPSSAYVIPAPTSGWNTRDPLHSMDPSFATTLDNWYPELGYVRLRRGTKIFASGDAAPGVDDAVVAMDYFRGVIVMSVRVGVYNYIKSITSAGTVTDRTPGAGSTFSQFVMFHNFNQVSVVVDRLSTQVATWDGTSSLYAAATITISGGTPTTWSAVGSYKSRLYLAASSNYHTHVICYGGVGAYGGTFTRYDISSLLRLPGQIVYVGSATRQEGATDSEMFVVISSSGEILTFYGDYPGSTTWSLAGRYYIGRLLGVSQQGVMQWGAHLYIMSRDGVVCLGDVIASQGAASGYANISDPIGPNFLGSSISSGTETCGIINPAGQMMVINTKESGSSTTCQWVCNLKTRAWARWNGMGLNYAGCWVVAWDKMYFGTTTYARVMQADYSTNNTIYDESPASTLPSIDTVSVYPYLRTAYNYLGDFSHKKQFIMMRPHLESAWTSQVYCQTNVDYKNVSNSTENYITFNPTGSGTMVYSDPLLSATGNGKAVAVYMYGSTFSETRLAAIELFYKTGGII